VEHVVLAVCVQITGGDPDVVVAITDTVAFGFGGTGTATELPSWTMQPLGLATGDLNADGQDDVLYADFSDNRLRWGVGTGSGLSMSFTGEGTAAGPSAVAAGDLDGDNDDDVVVAHATANSVAVFKSNGGPNVAFTKVLTDASIGGSTGVPAMAPMAIALGDLDGDGDLDVVTANADDSQGESSVSLLLNDGSGNLSIAPGFPAAVGRRPVDIVVADVNGDGAPDILTAHDYVDQGSSHVNVLLATP
ncbi:MAG: VCBS repeat-containing protein, partial [Polyangiaceae bacterium]